MLICYPDNLQVSFKSLSTQDRIFKAVDTWDSVRQEVQKQARRKPSYSLSMVSIYPCYGKTHPMECEGTHLMRILSEDTFGPGIMLLTFKGVTRR